MSSPLRQRLSKLYGAAPRAEPSDLRRRLEKLHPSTASRPLEEVLGGVWADRPEGRVLIVDRDYRLSHRHGNIALETMLELGGSQVDVLAANADFKSFSPQRTLFLDTETTGLSGGTGTCAFLIGVGYFCESSFRIRQLFLPGYQHERAFLQILGELVKETGARYLVTFNGKCYDLNLLGYRFVLQKVEHSLSALQHLDLLHPSRVLWRDCFSDCTLQTLERNLLQYGRKEDIPGFAIPRLYFNYLHTGSCRFFDRIFEHNRLDILTLVGLLVRASQACQQPDKQFFVSPLQASRLYQLRGDLSTAERLLEDSLKSSSSSNCAILLELGLLKKRLKKKDQALALLETALRHSSRPPLTLLIEAAKILEHHRGDFAAALELVNQALQFETTPELEHREYRLRQRLAGKRWYSFKKVKGIV